MPKLLVEQEIRLEWGDIDRRIQRPAPRLARSSGVHLSGVIKYVLTTAGLLTPDDITDEMPLRMAVGMAWETFIVGLWPEMEWQPGEIKMDGVIGSPDGITEDILEEVKATWMSRLEPKAGSRDPGPMPARKVTEIRRWMLQVAGYCYMLGLNRARMHILWVNGDYRGSGPQYFTYLIEFTQQELERVWRNMIIPNRDSAEPEVHE